MSLHLIKMLESENHVISLQMHDLEHNYEHKKLYFF